eukprot:956058-Pyramimonas_sp.AAC.1
MLSSNVFERSCAPGCQRSPFPEGGWARPPIWLQKGSKSGHASARGALEGALCSMRGWRG